MRSLLAFCLIAAPSSFALGAEHTKDSLETVRRTVRAGKAVLIDVRELREWTAGHLERASLVPLSDLKTTEGLKKAVAKLPTKKPIYVHCKSGGRCLIAAELFAKHGLDARALKPGYVDLVEAGFERAK